jgi:hypothetical protein
MKAMIIHRFSPTKQITGRDKIDTKTFEKWTPNLSWKLTGENLIELQIETK